MPNDAVGRPVTTGEGDDEGDEVDASQPALKLAQGSDVCKALMDRYSKSSAPQHRHLCASAAAVRSILQEEGLPLTPPAYLAAVITALRDADAADHDAVAALSAFLAILLPLVPVESMPPSKAKDAAFVLAAFLQEAPGSLPTGAVRSVVKSLGFLALRLDSEDWGAVKIPLEVLLGFSVDKRPKVRRCAHLCVENVFGTLKIPNIKKASKLVLSLYRKHISLAAELCIPEDGPDLKLSKTEHLETIHMLTILKLSVPCLSEEIRVKIFSDVLKFLGSASSLFTRHIIGLVDTIVEQTEPKLLIAESDKTIAALTLFISSSEKNRLDITALGLNSLRNLLNKLCDVQPTIWIDNLPMIFMSVKGHLGVDDINTSKVVYEIFKDIINVHIDLKVSMATARQLCNSVEKSTPETSAIVYICSGFNNMLDVRKVPTESMLGVISVLFLKLGKMSSLFMKDILLKLSKLVKSLEGGSPMIEHLQGCIGSAVHAMGPKKVLSLIPISFSVHNLTCSNMWLVPILKKHVIGGSLSFFMEHIVPIARSIQKACSRVKKPTWQQRLRSQAHKLWNLLPAFCRYPTDTSQSFDSLAKLLVHLLKDDSSLHETVSISLQTLPMQILVGENLRALGANQALNQHSLLDGVILKHLDEKSQILPAEYSKKTASKNLKALSSSSMDLIETLAEVFFDSPPDKHVVLTESIESLSSLVKGEDLHKFFLSLLKKVDLLNMLIETNKFSEGVVEDANTNEETSKAEKIQEKRCLVVKLLPSFVEVANENLVNLIFDFIRSSLLATNTTNKVEELFALRKILEKHSWFCAARVDDLIQLLQGVDRCIDDTVEKNRLACYHHLLVHIIKINEEKANTKAFLILNEIILTIKSKKATRKLAYDFLLETRCSLKNCHSEEAKSDLQRLFIMVMGYLSSSSPLILSGAISALSLLIYSDAEYCLVVPNLIPSILVLLQNKSNEVIKAALGFVKVLVSSLHADKLTNLVPDILSGIFPLSEVSRYHFKSKVAVILEILIRKCGFEVIASNTPKKYKNFLKTTAEGRQNKKKSEAPANAETSCDTDGFVSRRGKKRHLDEAPSVKDVESTSNIKRGRWKKRSDSYNVFSETGDEDGYRIIRNHGTSKITAPRKNKRIKRNDINEKTKDGHRITRNHGTSKTTVPRKNKRIKRNDVNQKTKEFDRIKISRKTKSRKTE